MRIYGGSPVHNVFTLRVFFGGVMSWIPPSLTPLFWFCQPRPINPLNTFKYLIGILKIIEIPINPNDRICHFFSYTLG